MSELLYQAIMKVPGLTGATPRARQEELYKKLGSPMGPYKATYAQNIDLLKRIQSNDYYKAGLPGAQLQSTGGSTSTSRAGTILNDSTQNINDRTKENYSEEVMSQSEWYQPFDEWTRNFAATYMQPEWERDVYDPSMRQLNKGMGDYRQQTGNSGAWRSTMAGRNLAQMGEDAIKEEERMRREFQESVLETRDAIRSNLANPLYESNMKRWYDAPWGGMDYGADDLQGSVPGITGDDLDSLIKQINTWTPGGSNEGPFQDWTVNPNSKYSQDIFRQYYTQPNSGQY